MNKEQVAGIKVSFPPRLVFRTKIDNIVKKETTVGGKKAADGTAELIVEDAGWHIIIGNLSIFVGDDEPGFAKGDKIRLIIEKETP
jgi:hypothetical protein